jgi:ubiquinone/menaquinone biosynthesis C-methylase UbiE
MTADYTPGIFQKSFRHILKLFFNLLYHQFAWTYDWVADIVSIGRWKSWVYIPIPFLKGSKVLELGCGPGHLQLALSRKQISSYGLDSSQEMVRIAANRLTNESRPVNIIQAKSQHIPFPEGSFDKLVATFPSDYLFDPESLSQAWRVLNNSGELIILPAAWITGKVWMDKLAAWIFRVTGQSPIVELLQENDDAIFPISILNELGFIIRKEIIELQSSKVILIHAEKVVQD